MRSIKINRIQVKIRFNMDLTMHTVFKVDELKQIKRVNTKLDPLYPVLISSPLGCLLTIRAGLRMRTILQYYTYTY